MPQTTRRDKATTFEAMIASGVKTLELPTPTEKVCSACGRLFFGKFMAELQVICPDCVEASVRLTEEDARASRTEQRRRRLAGMGLVGKLLGMTFATFAPAEQPAAYEAARNFVAAWPLDQGLAFLGERGVGKTHLATAILHVLSERDEAGRYVHLPSLASDLAMAKDWQEAATALFVPLYTTPVLVLDDAGR